MSDLLKDREIELGFSRTIQVRQFEPAVARGKFFARVEDEEDFEEALDAAWTIIEEQMDKAENVLADFVKRNRLV